MFTRGQRSGGLAPAALLWAGALLLTCGTALPAADGAAGGRFENLGFDVGGIQRTAALWIPAGYDRGTGRWPLIVYLHGGGGRGDNQGNALSAWLDRQPLARAIREHPGRFPALVVFPRCPEDKIWAPTPADPIQSEWRLRRHGTQSKPDAEDHVTAVIDTIRNGFRLDDDRVIVSGHSMGGEGSIRYAALHHAAVAAVAPSAGSAIFVPEDAEALAGIGVWMFQGETDPISTAPLARRMVEAIRAAGGEPRYTEYEGVGHATARLAFEDPELIAWMLRQHRSRP